tara:strand:- start:290 stop:490 length:201 start_codon:yes stop_codon:yes gene_type:complete
MDSNLSNRFEGTLSGIIFALILTALYWILGFIIFKITKKEIRTSTGYLIIIVAGFVLNRTLPKIFM